MISPLVDAGKMPALAALIEGGVIGNLASLQPMLSPMLWTTIATGRRAHRHGIYGFVEPRPESGGVRPVASTSRQVKAIWNMLTQAGLRTHAIGWLASHPAEPINGVCVSDQFRNLADDPSTPPPAGSVFPERLSGTLAALRVRPEEVAASALLPFVPRAAEIDLACPAARKPLEVLARLLSECATIHAAATWAMEHEPWDFTAVYYDSLDRFGHAFMAFHPPRMEGIDAALFDLYHGVMEGIYRFHDMMLARLLELAGSDAIVILASDHGFYSNHLRPRLPGAAAPLAANPVAWHRPHGVLAMRGPGLLADERVAGASLLDIVPTVLTLFGLPVAGEMEGRPLVQAFREPPAIAWIPSWDRLEGEAGLHPAWLRVDPADSREMLRHLGDLGYVAPPTGGEAAAAAAADEDLAFHRAQSLLHAGEHAAAAASLGTLAAAHPADPRYALGLAQAWLQMGRLAEAREAIETVATQAGDLLPQRDLLLGILLHAEGRPAEAVAALGRAAEAQPGHPRLHQQLGDVHLRSRRWREAESAFRRALEIDPDCAAAWCGLARTSLRLGRPAPAAEQALRALGLQHCYPAAHFALGMALARLGRRGRAAQAFEAGLRMGAQPSWALRYYARLRRWVAAARAEG